jgi:hypothetical protein
LLLERLSAAHAGFVLLAPLKEAILSEERLQKPGESQPRLMALLQR